MTGSIQFCGDITLYGISTFMPAIIKGLGYANVYANLLTVPVYFVAAAAFLTTAYLSDKYQLRSPFIAFGFVMYLIGESRQT